MNRHYFDDLTHAWTRVAFPPARRDVRGSMITRIVMLMLIAALAVPVAALTRPAQTDPSPWGEVAVDAKGKRPKHRKTPKFKTVRRQVTRTFTSSNPMTIPAGAPANEEGPATPYPSAIEVSGLPNGTITDVNLILTDLTHDHPSDVDLLLSSSDGRRALVVSDVGRTVNAVDLDFTLDDEAAASLPESMELRSGTFRPADLDPNAADLDFFTGPAPAPDGAVALNTFDGTDPNGTWQVWVMDDSPGDDGDLAGWALEITAEVDVKVKHKKGKGRH